MPFGGGNGRPPGGGGNGAPPADGAGKGGAPGWPGNGGKPRPPGAGVVLVVFLDERKEEEGLTWYHAAWERWCAWHAGER